MPIISESSAADGPTLDELVDDIVSQAQGVSISPDKIVTLQEALSDTALTMKVSGDVTPGVFEIEDELVLVTSVDSGTCQIHPRGRGWQGTTAAAHADGEIVLESPVLPRSRVVQWVNDMILSLYPSVFAVASLEATLSGLAVELPADAEFVLDVRAKDVDGDWQRVRRWEAEAESLATVTGRTVLVPGLCDGTSVQVVYAVRPEALITGDQRWSDTGLSLALRDVVTLGVLARFAKTLDIGRLSDRFATPRGDNQQPQITAGFTIGRALQADYQAALDREVRALRDLYPVRSHFVR